MTIVQPGIVIVAVFATAFAQVLLKKASFYDIRTASWLLLMGISACSYAASFVLYSRILKHFELNKIYPAMTVGQLILVTVYGLWIGEVIDARHTLGLMLGVLSIYLILA